MNQDLYSALQKMWTNDWHHRLTFDEAAAMRDMIERLRGRACKGCRDHLRLLLDGRHIKGNGYMRCKAAVEET